ncbi:hypothetical protein FACS189472_09710 [Alphaproteobacteria bacterium]|nr:hypothetical protein FACS189472_09710 [Alphaproteobacteria bacterium]
MGSSCESYSTASSVRGGETECGKYGPVGKHDENVEDTEQPQPLEDEQHT